jgi:hypothetical protein
MCLIVVLMSSIGLGMSISSVNEDPRGDYLVWRSEDGEFFPVRMEDKVPPKEVWGMGTVFHPPPREDSVPENY